LLRLIALKINTQRCQKDSQAPFNLRPFALRLAFFLLIVVLEDVFPVRLQL
jgi:hypothetical protein